MPAAPKHCDEGKRLQSLYRYEILDSGDDPAFDDIVRLASYICEAPIAVVNLIDADRQWFKSEIGLGVRETPLDISLCAHAILQPGVFIVPDTLQDDRFVDNPLVERDPHLRFYAGALLESSDGYPLGTLCVLDYQPRDLTGAQATALSSLGRQVMALIEARVHAREAERLNSQLRRTMAESHHRIKNNLQILSALVDLQRPDAGGNVSHTEFVRMGQHIRGLATIHDLLTHTSKRGDDTDRISVIEAFEKITAILRPMIGDRPLRADIQDATVSVKQGSSLAILGTELLGNAIKHGRGLVEIHFREADGWAELAVSDEGPGFPPGFDPETAANTGLELISSLAVWDLNGTVSFENRDGGGARVTVRFPLTAA